MKIQRFDILMIVAMTFVLVGLSQMELLQFALIPMLVFYFVGKYAGQKSKFDKSQG